MLTRFFFCAGLGVITVFGQAPKPAAAKPAPAKAKPRPTPEEALRARVSEFLQYHVDAKFSKAMDLVAAETKEEYFASGKQKLKSFKIDSIKLTDNNTKAVVTATVTRDWEIQMQRHEVIVPMVTSWKLEKGLWYWYWDPSGAWLTPMGPSKIEPPSLNPDGTIKGRPPSSAEEVSAAAVNILARSSLDKYEIVLDPTVASEQQVSFTNGVQGYVTVALDSVPNIPGFTAKLENTQVPANAQAKILISYQPSPDVPVPQDFSFRLVTEPLNQGYPIRVRFSHPE